MVRSWAWLVVWMVAASCRREATPEPGYRFDYRLGEGVAPGETFPPGMVLFLDAFETPDSVVQRLRAQGVQVIGYISVGTWEAWRPDTGLVPPSLRGKPYPGWPGEYFVDLRDTAGLALWIRRRLDMLQAKGFDGVDPDNIDIYTAETGFPLSQEDVLRFVRWLAREAHARGLRIGQKNAPELVDSLVESLDFAVLESAFTSGIASAYQPYRTKGRLVFAVEYTDEMTVPTFKARVCPQARKLGYAAILKNRTLDRWQVSCP